MCAKKTTKPAPSGTSTAVRLLLTRGRWAVVIVLFLGTVGIAWRMAWVRVQNQVLTDNDYQVTLKDIVVTPLPAWIHTDIKTEVLRDASLSGSMSILDEDLTKRIATAFELHPWVARVVRVSKRHPARVEVEVQYRKPVAMVEVSGGLLPVDAEGTLLPSEDFSPADARKYPRISRIESHPIGTVGKNWGDVNVAGAAQIAHLLSSRWQSLKLYRVLAPGRDTSTREVDRYTYELSTQGGTRILWGRPPGSEPSGELPAAAKLELLDHVAAQSGGLDGAEGPRLIDVRSGTARAPRTAIKPLAPTATGER